MTVKTIQSKQSSVTQLKQIKTSSETDKKMANCRSKISDLVQGIVNSRVFTALAVTAVAVGFLFLLLSNPAGWVIAAVAVGVFVAVLFMPTGSTKQMLEFEVSAAVRALKKKNFHEIQIGRTSGKLFLGAIPNRLTSDGEKLANYEKVGAVLSLNEPRERRPTGLSLPYQAEDWKAMGVEYKMLNIHDHTLLDNESLDQAADFIYENIKAGKSVYVHCRAGVGRSAMAIAAYLIKYEYKTAEQAAEIIKTSRPCSTIKKKIKGLKEFELYVQQRAAQMPERMKKMAKFADNLNAYSDKKELEYMKKSADLLQFAAFHQDWNPDPLY